MTFSWKIAAVRWLKGLLVGVTAALAMNAPITVDGVIVAAISGLIAAVIIDLDAFVRANEPKDE